MAIEGVDYAWERPDPAGLYRAGKRFASRYLSYNTTGKNLTIAERDALWAAGLSIVLNWEAAASGALTGRAGGIAHATKAEQLRRDLGAPNDIPIYFSIDFLPAGTQWTTVADYMQGVRSVIGIARTGIYGGYETIDRAVMGHWAKWLWQTYAWSGGRWHPAAHVQQYRNGVSIAGGIVDLDRATTDYFGQWKGSDVLTEEQATQLRDTHFTLTTPEAGGAEHVRWILMGERIATIESALTTLLGRGGDDQAAKLAKLEELVTSAITDIREVRDRPQAIVSPEAIREAFGDSLRETVEDAVAGVLRTARNPQEDTATGDTEAGGQ